MQGLMNKGRDLGDAPTSAIVKLNIAKISPAIYAMLPTAPPSFSPFPAIFPMVIGLNSSLVHTCTPHHQVPLSEKVVSQQVFQGTLNNLLVLGHFSPHFIMLPHFLQGPIQALEINKSQIGVWFTYSYVCTELQFHNFHCGMSCQIAPQAMQDRLSVSGLQHGIWRAFFL